MSIGAAPRPSADRAPGWRHTRLAALLAWARAASLAPYSMLSGCCGAELSAVFGPRFDIERFGLEWPRCEPEQADLLIVAGTVTRALAPRLVAAYERMPGPRRLLAVGACASGGGPYDNYATLPGVDALLPVDVYVPGCPPHPEALLDGLRRLQARIRAEGRPSLR